MSIFDWKRRTSKPPQAKPPEPSDEEIAANLIEGIETESDLNNLLYNLRWRFRRHTNPSASLRRPTLIALRAAGKGAIIDRVVEEQVKEQFVQTISTYDFEMLRQLVEDAELDFDDMSKKLGGPRIDLSVFDGFTPCIADEVRPYIELQYEKQKPEAPLAVPERGRNSLLAN